MDRPVRLGLWLGGLLCIATAASAVDGVIEINQAAVRAGGITPSDTPGFPATLDQGGSYRLTGNLSVIGLPSAADVTAILVTAGNVTIDLNGFAIIGPALCSGSPPQSPVSCLPSGTGIGISTQGKVGITVRNGTVRGMGNNGLELGNLAAVEEVQAIGNGGDGIGVGGTSIVRNCIAESNQANGIDLGGTSTAAGNVVSNNGASGISQSSPALTATGNTATQNFSSGISAGSGSTIVGNTLRGNGGFGLSPGADSGYTNNVINSNTGGTVNGGFEMPPNICNGDTTCP